MTFRLKTLSVLSSLVMLAAGPLSSQAVRIGLFNDKSIQTFIFSVNKGGFELLADSSKTKDLSEGAIVYLSLIGNHLSIRDMHGLDRQAKEVELHAKDSACVFFLRPAYPAMEARSYQGSCLFNAGIGRIAAINVTGEDQYLAAVVAAEGGTGATLEFYKAQAILCRTYLHAHFEKHETDSFNVCDGVHCQAYKGINGNNPYIAAAVTATHGLVAVYADTSLITAAYHANCGGETQNSENEWLQMLPYLRSVRDPWCANSRNSTWKTTIPRGKWIGYLQSNGLRLSDSVPAGALDFRQDSRQAYYHAGTDSLALRKIRTDWGFKSSFFSMHDRGDGIIEVNGRGYGHGIGLCQTGAINMSAKGMKYNEILDFYFRGITLRQIGELRPGYKRMPGNERDPLQETMQRH